jgi:steroid 5-alpha reductase family enzyme
MSYFLALAVVLFGYMNVWFVISLLKKRNDVADSAWGLGFVVVAWVAYFLSEETSLRGLVVNSLVTVWGARLAWHIYRRNKGKSEDYRYLAWRQEWGKWFYLRSYAQVYLLQGALLYCIALPVMLVNRNVGQPLGVLDGLAFGVWLVGFLFEAVGDAQLARFISNPLNKGKIIQSGLWGYSRHPNYFGEVTQWWGIGLSALTVPGGAFGIIGPLTITFLILKVSGIPLLERKMVEKPEFAEYKKRVSMFFPLPPKNNS